MQLSEELRDPKGEAVDLIIALTHCRVNNVGHAITSASCRMKRLAAYGNLVREGLWMKCGIRGCNARDRSDTDI